MRPSTRPSFVAVAITSVSILAGSTGASDRESPPLQCELQKVGTEEEARFLARSVTYSVFRRCDSGNAKSVYLHFAPDDLACSIHETACPGRAAVGFLSCLGTDDPRSFWLPRGPSWRLENPSGGELPQAARIEATEGGALGSDERTSHWLELGARDEPLLDREPLAPVRSPLLREVLGWGGGGPHCGGSGPSIKTRIFGVLSEAPCQNGPWSCVPEQRLLAVTSCRAPFEHATYELPHYFRWKQRGGRDLGGNDFRLHDRPDSPAEADATSVHLTYRVAWPREKPEHRAWWRWIDLDIHVSPARGVVADPRGGPPWRPGEPQPQEALELLTGLPPCTHPR